MIEVISAANPRFATPDRGVIVLDVQFAHLATPVKFSASPHDPEPYGRWLFAMARDGEFGVVAERVTLTPLAMATSANPPLRASKMAQAVECTTHWDMMGDVEQAAAWRSYYRALYALEQRPEWPLVEQWPTPPAPLTI